MEVVTRGKVLFHPFLSSTFCAQITQFSLVPVRKRNMLVPSSRQAKLPIFCDIVGYGDENPEHKQNDSTRRSPFDARYRGHDPPHWYQFCGYPFFTIVVLDFRRLDSRLVGNQLLLLLHLNS
jgi:hypothetical protein